MKIIKTVLVFLFITFFVTACINYKELDDLILISAIGIDYDGESFSLILQEVHGKDEIENTKYEYVYHKVNCIEINDCINKSNHISDKELYFFTTETIIMNKEVMQVLLPNLHTLFSDINDHAFVFTTEEDILTLFEMENNFQYINNINDTDLNMLMILKRNILSNQKVYIPVLGIVDDEIIIQNILHKRIYL